jgi:hypothetical protein
MYLLLMPIWMLMILRQIVSLLKLKQMRSSVAGMYDRETIFFVLEKVVTEPHDAYTPTKF